jgi:hypothetical protein
VKECAIRKEKELLDALDLYKDFTISLDKRAREDSKQNPSSRKFCIPQSIKELNEMVIEFNKK